MGRGRLFLEIIEFDWRALPEAHHLQFDEISGFEFMSSDCFGGVDEVVGGRGFFL